MRHRMHLLLSAPTGGSSHYRARGRYLWRKEARLCRGECTPHFLFETSKRKCAVHGGKEKMSWMSCPAKRSTHPKRGAGRHGLPTKFRTLLSAALYLNLKSVRRRICGHGAQRGTNRTSPAPLSAAAPPSCPGRGVQRGVTLPSSFVPRSLGRGFQRGGTAVPPLCATRGHGGRVASPMFRVGV